MATKEPTAAQKQQILSISGWLCVFSGVIGAALQELIGHTTAVADILMCFIDRKFVKDYKGVSIPWGYCLITPLYLYQRAVRLKESKTKFIISLVLFCLGILGLLLTIAEM